MIAYPKKVKVYCLYAFFSHGKEMCGVFDSMQKAQEYAVKTVSNLEYFVVESQLNPSIDRY